MYVSVIPAKAGISLKSLRQHQYRIFDEFFEILQIFRTDCAVN